MSETASAGTAVASAGTQAGATPQASGNAQGSDGGAASQAQGTGDQAQNPTSAQEQRRVLAEQDLDAYIEHTINGKKEQIKLRDLTKAYGLDKTANQRLQEAARVQREQQQLAHLFKTDFNKWCEVTGTDRDQFLESNLSQRKDIAEKILAKEYELSQMPEAERRALELENQLKEFQGREMAQKQPLIDSIKAIVSDDQLKAMGITQKQLDGATVGQLNQFLEARQGDFQRGLDQTQNELLDAWQKTGMPREKSFGAWTAQVMLDSEKQAAAHFKKTGEKIQTLQAAEAAGIVKARFLNSTRSILSQMDATAIHEMLGAEIIQKLRDHDTGLASQQGPTFGQPANGPAQAASQPKQYTDVHEWRKAMGAT